MKPILLHKQKKEEKLKLTDTAMTDQYKMIIVSLNGVTERSKVEEFVDVMPAMDATHLRKEYERARPDVDMTCLRLNVNSVMLKIMLISHSRPTFFGLNEEYNRICL